MATPQDGEGAKGTQTPPSLTSDFDLLPYLLPPMAELNGSNLYHTVSSWGTSRRRRVESVSGETNVPLTSHFWPSSTSALYKGSLTFDQRLNRKPNWSNREKLKLKGNLFKISKLISPFFLST